MFKRGQQVFNEGGRIREVAVDNRHKPRGSLWLLSGYGGREGTPGQWFATDDPQNAELYNLCTLQQGDALKPIREAQDALKKRSVAISRFIHLTVLATQDPTLGLSITDLTDFSDSFRHERTEELVGTLGPTSPYKPELSVSLVSGIGGPLKITGPKGEIIIEPPPELA